MKINKECAEFIGILLGDGYIYGNYRSYIIGVVGHPEDEEYFLYIKKIISKIFGEVNIREEIRQGARRLIFQSKEVFKFLTDELKIPYGKSKGESSRIPQTIIDRKLHHNTIRRLFDADGTIFISKKPGISNYPSIELVNTNLELMQQTRDLLLQTGFKVSKIRSRPNKNKKHKKCYCYGLYGFKNMLLWELRIGFSHPKKRAILKKAWERRDLNPRPHRLQRCALPLSYVPVIKRKESQSHL